MSETRQLLSSVDEHCNWVIVSQLRNSTSVSLPEIDEALAAYTQLIKSGNESQTKLPLREELVRCFDKWIGSVPQGIDEAIVLDLANEWEEREFASLTFSDLTSLMLLKGSISKYFTFRNGDSDKRNRILCSLEVVGQHFVFWMLRNVVLVTEKRSHASKLQNTFAAVHDSDFVLRHELLAGLLIVQAV